MGAGWQEWVGMGVCFLLGVQLWLHAAVPHRGEARPVWQRLAVGQGSSWPHPHQLRRVRVYVGSVALRVTEHVVVLEACRRPAGGQRLPGRGRANARC